MKRIDVTKSVMEKVAHFERKRSTGWLWNFWMTLGVLLVLVLFILWRVWEQLQEGNTLDLLSLFGQDMEIIREFWRDTVSVFIEELPQGALFFAGLILVGLGMFMWATRKKRKIISRRIRELAKRNHT